MAGGYPQQGYQARPPTNWAPPGLPMQQSGYGYTQPGSSPQYGMNQPPYSGYPPQAASSVYSSGWDQTTAPPNQQTAQGGDGGGYDYYNQQPPPQQHQAQGGPGTPTDGSVYGCNQASAYSQGQGYAQDSYSGYHAGAGYGQPQPNPVGTGYEQQQGYNTAYGNVSNLTPDGHPSSYGAESDANQAPASGQSYNTGGHPSPNPNYPPQASNQASYGGPPSSQVTMELNHALVISHMGSHRIKNHLAVNKLMHSHSSRLVVREVAILNLDIHRLVILGQTRVHRNHHHQVICSLS